MNKKILIILAAVVVVGVAAYFVFAGRGPTNQISNLTSETPSATESLKQLLTSGQKVTCTFSDNAEGLSQNGTIIIADEKMRGDFDSQYNGQNTKSHMIVDGNQSYTWLDGQKDGYKIAFNPKAGDQVAANTPPDTQKGLDLEKKMNYKCQPWSGAGDAFKLPAGVNFIDLADFTKQMQPTAPVPNTSASTGSAAQCVACDSLPASAKTQCRAALGCK